LRTVSIRQIFSTGGRFQKRAVATGLQGTTPSSPSIVAVVRKFNPALAFLTGAECDRLDL
jgi:hypothetical protein